jgi:dienelactone hydrolase
MIPLEYFDTALAWLRRQPEVDPARIGIVGVSKGAEAALLVAVRHPELKAVIAALPSSVVWPGIVWEGTPERINSSWSERGKPLPHMTHAPYDARKGGTMADNYARSLQAYAERPDAIIPVEKITAPLLLVCGTADEVSPSCPMLRQIEERLRQHRRPEPTSFVHEGVGHRAFGLPLSAGNPRFKPGDTANAKLAEGWAKAVEFLKQHLSK